jgi:hypothetical protein
MKVSHIYLVKYRPLVSTPEGVQPAKRFGIPPFVDGSCRREPDFESKFPSISALCRGTLFAPKLKEEDEVVYITTKNLYGETFWHRRIVAHLKVIKRFDSHTAAAKWYQAQGLCLPSNCMVAGSKLFPLSQTSRGASNCAPGCGSAAASLKKWNEHYQKRADSIPVFVVCKTVWKELESPAILTDQAAFKILGSWERVRSRLPIKITVPELQAIDAVARTFKGEP